MRQSTSIWQSQTVTVRWPLAGERLKEIPLAVWGLVVIAAAFALSGVLGAGLPVASDPAVAQLQSDLALAVADARDLSRQGELKDLEVERFRRIHQFSSEFSVPASLATDIHDIALAEGIALPVHR